MVSSEGTASVINGGSQTGSNLFHSFEQFSVPTDSTAYFNNSAGIENIFSRVTGSSISNIEGILKANGTANLFLINPNGIIFGANAKLDLGGSFVGSTSNFIRFADGFEFSAKNPQTTPLLTVSVPIGLGFGSAPGGINVQGKGHSLSSSPGSPFNRDSSSKPGLQVRANKTLALVGGNLALEGGILTAEGGRIELGSIEQGLVNLSSNASGWNFDYANVTNFQDIQLSQRALADASGEGSGGIQIIGQNIGIGDDSSVLIQNQGALPPGNININASESLQLDGKNSVTKFTGGLWNETTKLGSGGEISISTKYLSIQSGDSIYTRTFNTSKGGDINIKAAESVQLIGASPIDPDVVSSIGAFTFRSGQAGNVTVSTKKLVARNGGGLGSTTFGIGRGGNLTLNADDSVEIIGGTPTFQPSLLSTSTLNSGDAGNLTINTSKLKVSDGGRVSSSTLSFGNAGSVIINASDSVDVISSMPGSRNPSLITSSANIVDKNLQQIYKLPPVPSGRSGDMTINTKDLNVTNNALINVKNEGFKDAGSLRVNANSIKLDTEGGITAASASGEGGDIFVRSQFLQLLNGSSITTNVAGGMGNGGNIAIDTNILTALNGSSITADAVQGRGGNIVVDTDGLFLSPNSKITATSQLGINGTVQINSLISQPTNGLIELPQQALDVTNLVAQRCPANVASEPTSFVVIGPGGLPENPYQPLNVGSVWEDLRQLPDNQPHDEPITTEPTETNTQETANVEPATMVEASSLAYNNQGEVMLVASLPKTATLPLPQCQKF